MKRSVRMIASDLDGTLLRTDKTISGYTKTVLNQCRKLGIKVVYATGRGGSANRVAPAQLFDGRISMNGATAIVDDVVVYNRLIPYKEARPILMACDKRGLKTTAELSGLHYSNFKTSDKWPDTTNYRIVDFSLLDIDAEKLNAIIDDSDDVSFIKDLLPKDYYLSVSRDGLAMVMHREATKAKALAELARIWGIAQSEIAAFGDDLNDIDMLSFAGIGVAVENALDEVKAASDQVCSNNDEDGVAKWIEENVF